jgi:hypothetical protein
MKASLASGKFGRVIRDALVSHIDGARVPFPPEHTQERRAARFLIAHDLIEPLGKVAAPAATLITDKGRAALARILGEQIDQLAAMLDEYGDLIKRIGLPHIAGQLAIVRRLIGIRRNSAISAIAGKIPHLATIKDRNLVETK